jgi:membrane protease YdiL (CAAX protease family)
VNAAIFSLADAVRKIPKWLEMTIVLVVAFAPFLYSSTAELIAPSEARVTQADFAGITSHQIIVSALLLAFLFLRGWRVEELGIRRFQFRELFETGLLLASYIFIVWSLWYLIGAPEQSGEVQSIDSAGMSFGFIALFSLVNAGFEEVFVCAYVIAALGAKRAWIAIALSAALRVSYHLYQGPLALITVLPFGILLAWYFAQRARLAPLIVVHASFDILALVAYVGEASQ